MTQPPPPQPPAPRDRASVGGHPAPPPGWAQGQPAAQVQPAAPGQPTGWSQAPAIPGSPSRPRRNGLAIAAIAVAGLMLLLGPMRQVAFQVGIEAGDGAASLGAIGSVFTVLGIVLALVVLALGIVALLLPDRARLLAAAAVGIGASSLAGTILGLATGFVLSFG